MSSTILKIGGAHNEAGKKFLASDFISENEHGLYWKESQIFTVANLKKGDNLIGDGTTGSPLDWKGFEVQDSQGNPVSSEVQKLKSGTGLVFAEEKGYILVKVDLSEYSANSISLSGGNTKLLLNGHWSLQDGNSVKIASENASTAYLYSSDANIEYPTLKAKSNAGNAERAYLLLDASNKVPETNMPTASASKLGGVKVNGENLSVNSAGLISWTGFSVFNKAFENLSSEIKNVRAGDNINFSTEDGMLTISSEGGSGDFAVSNQELTFEKVSKITFSNAELTKGADGEVIINFKGGGGDPSAVSNTFQGFSIFPFKGNNRVKMCFGNIGENFMTIPEFIQNSTIDLDMSYPSVFKSSLLPTT